MSSEKLIDLLNPSKDGDLGELIGRARQMGELTGILCKSLPAADQGAIVAANVRDGGELVVICASSAWAAKLRYRSDKLLKVALDAGINASSCRVCVSQN